MNADYGGVIMQPPYAAHHDEGVNALTNLTTVKPQKTPQMDGYVEETSSPACSSRWFPVGVLPNKSHPQYENFWSKCNIFAPEVSFTRKSQ